MSWLLYGLVAVAAYKLVGGPTQRRPRRRSAPTEDPYAVLGVSADADDDAVSRAYKQRVARYHPDRVDGAAPELQQLAELRTKQLNAAYAEIRRRRGAATR